jgi:hypothetical protein
MKVNNPILDVTNPIFIDSDEKWNLISKRLTKLGYHWTSGSLADEWKPPSTKFYIYCYSDKFLSFNEELMD